MVLGIRWQPHRWWQSCQIYFKGKAERNQTFLVPPRALSWAPASVLTDLFNVSACIYHWCLKLTVLKPTLSTSKPNLLHTQCPSWLTSERKLFSDTKLLIFHMSRENHTPSQNGWERGFGCTNIDFSGRNWLFLSILPLFLCLNTVCSAYQPEKLTLSPPKHEIVPSLKTPLHLSITLFFLYNNTWAWRVFTMFIH